MLWIFWKLFSFFVYVNKNSCLFFSNAGHIWIWSAQQNNDKVFISQTSGNFSCAVLSKVSIVWYPMVQNLVNCGCHISPKVSILLSYAQFFSFVFRLHEITRNMILNRLITSWCTPVIRAAVSKSEKNHLAVFPLFEFPSPCFGWSIIRPSWWYCSWISFFS